MVGSRPVSAICLSGMRQLIVLVRVLPQISHLVRSFHSSRRIYETASAVKLPPEKELLAAFEFFQLSPQAEVPMSESQGRLDERKSPLFRCNALPCLETYALASQRNS